MIINGQQYNLQEKVTVFQLLEHLNLNADRIVIEVNGLIVNKEDYDSYLVDEKAQIEIVSFVGGG